MRAAIVVACWLIVAPTCARAGEVVSPRIRATQPLVAIFGLHAAYERPSAASRIVKVITSTRPITAARTTLPVLARVVDRQGHAWLRVRLPGRSLTGQVPPPTAWIRTLRTMRPTTPWHIVVERSLRRVTVYRAGHVVRVYGAIVGKPSTPTPRGEYFVEENVRLSHGQVGAPFALATSARSAVFQEFDGGPGQIALHGLGGVGGRLGSAVSHGCVRLGDRAISWLAARITPGVPITIR